MRRPAPTSQIKNSVNSVLRLMGLQVGTTVQERQNRLA